MSQAEWLLSNYEAYRCRLAILEVILAQYKADKPNDLHIHQVIEEMSLAAPVLSDISTTHGNGSKTEYIALHYQEQLRAQKEEELMRILSESKKLQYYINICDTMLASLSAKEKQLIENKYVLHKTYDRMLAELPDGIAPLSKSALWYQCKRVIKKLDGMLGEVRI